VAGSFAWFCTQALQALHGVRKPLGRNALRSNNPAVISTDTISPKDETMTAATDAHVLYLVPGAANGSLCAFT
jgi:methylmalonyl-CoA mutase cobalamin-binding subunit